MNRSALVLLVPLALLLSSSGADAKRPRADKPSKQRKVKAPTTQARPVAVGGWEASQVCAVMPDGRAWCFDDPTTATHVPALDRASSLHLNDQGVCGLVAGVVLCVDADGRTHRFDGTWAGFDGRLLRDDAGALWRWGGTLDTLSVEAVASPGPATHTSSFRDRSCWVLIDGRLVCDGELVPGVEDALQVAVDQWSLCVLHRSGAVSCGRGDALEPVVGVAGATALVVGGYGECAVVEGGITCWKGSLLGLAPEGGLRHHPLPDPSGAAVSMELCVTDAGGLQCTGQDRRLRPTVSPHWTDVVDVTLRTYSTCALSQAGEVSCAGLFPGPSKQKYHPTPSLAATGFTDIGTAYPSWLHLCGTTAEGVQCVSSAGTAPLKGPKAAAPLSSSGRRLCGTASRGESVEQVCWGGVNDDFNVDRFEAAEVSQPDWFWVCKRSAAGEVTCEDDANGESHTIGDAVLGPEGERTPLGPVRALIDGRPSGYVVISESGRLAYGWTTFLRGQVIEPFPQVSDFVHGSFGFAGVCGVRANGALLCAPAQWELPIAPAEADVLGDDITRVWSENGHACALRRSGQLACWGQNSAGRLGLGTGPGVWTRLGPPP